MPYAIYPECTGAVVAPGEGLRLAEIDAFKPDPAPLNAHKLYVRAGGSGGDWYTQDDAGIEKKFITGASGVGAFTLGSVPFADANGDLVENNANIFWDNSIGALSVGLNTGTGRLTVRDFAVPGIIADFKNFAGTNLLAIRRDDIRFGTVVGVTESNPFSVEDMDTVRGAAVLLPVSHGPVTSAPPRPGLIQWDTTYTTDFVNNNLGGVLNAIGTYNNIQAAFVFNMGLVFNHGINYDLDANGGPVFTLINQPTFEAQAGALTISQHNALRSQPTWSRVGGATLVQTSAQHLFMTATVDTGCTVTLMNYLKAANPTVTGLITELQCIQLDNISSPAIIRGIGSDMSNGLFLEQRGIAKWRSASDFHMDDGIAFVVGADGGNNVELLKPFAGAFRMIGVGGTFNEGLDFQLDASNNIRITSPTGASLNVNTIEFAFGPGVTADGTNNWVMAFAPGLRASQLAGDYAEVLFTSSTAITIAHALSTFSTWTVNAPTIVLGAGSIVSAANVLIQTNMNQGTNRYGLLVTSSPSGGTLNYCARFQGAAGVRIDGHFEHTGTTWGMFGAIPVVQTAAYTVTNPVDNRSFDTTTVTLTQLAEIVGTIIADWQAYGAFQ